VVSLTLRLNKTGNKKGSNLLDPSQSSLARVGITTKA